MTTKQTGRRINTNCFRISASLVDWSATWADYEPGDVIGRGSDEAEAIAALMIESDYEGAISINKDAP